MFRPIYEPRTRAREYADLAINIYTGCNHGCTYCYAEKNATRYGKPFREHIQARAGIAEATQKQLAGGKYSGKKIMLCFTCDPYPSEIDTTPTRDIIMAIKAAGAHVQILTKGGDRALRDFDLLDNGDSFGITYTGYDNIFSSAAYEPNAALPAERIKTAKMAHDLGVRTWVSVEPVYNPADIFTMIECADYFDFWKFGKTNHIPDFRLGMSWREYGDRVERYCMSRRLKYYIKEDLRNEMSCK